MPILTNPHFTTLEPEKDIWGQTSVTVLYQLHQYYTALSEAVL